MVKLSQFYHPARFFKKKKDKIAGGRNNTNDFNGGGDEEKKKEKDPSKVQDRVQQHMKLLEKLRVAEYVRKAALSFVDRDETSLGGGDDDNNDDGGGDDDSNDGGGGTNNKKDSDRDGDSNGDKNKSDRDSDGGGQMEGKNMDFMGKAGFGYRYGYHAGNENEYPVGQLQCAQEVQSSEPNCLFYHAIMIR